VTIEEGDPIGNVFKDRIQFLSLHLGSAVESRILQGNGGLRSQASEQRLVFIAEFPRLRVPQE